MVKKSNKNNADKINRKSLIKSSSIVLSQEPTFTLNNHNHDDIIKSLSNAPENLRARQVVEWERVQRKNFVQAV